MGKTFPTFHSFPFNSRTSKEWRNGQLMSKVQHIPICQGRAAHTFCIYRRTPLLKTTVCIITYGTQVLKHCLLLTSPPLPLLKPTEILGTNFFLRLIHLQNSCLTFPGRFFFLGNTIVANSKVVVLCCILAVLVFTRLNYPFLVTYLPKLSETLPASKMSLV